jgi:hypothetical protein
LFEQILLVVRTKAELALVDHDKTHGPYPGLISVGGREKKNFGFLQKFQDLFHDTSPSWLKIREQTAEV